MFKTGGRVKCIDNAGDASSVVGKIYKIKNLYLAYDDVRYMITTTCGVSMFSNRFELVLTSKPFVKEEWM